MAMNQKSNKCIKLVTMFKRCYFSCSRFRSRRGRSSNQPTQQVRQGSKESTGSSDTDSSSEDESIQATSSSMPAEQADKAKETEAGAEISALVNYVQPVHFSSFENAESKFLLLFNEEIEFRLITRALSTR